MGHPVVGQGPDMIKVTILQSWLVEIIFDCGTFLGKIRRFYVSQFGSTLEVFPQSLMYNKDVTFKLVLLLI